MPWNPDKKGNLKGVRGDSGQVIFRKGTQADKNAPFVPTDLTGVTVKAQVRSKPNGYVVFEFVPDYSQAADGYIILNVDADVTELIKVTEAVWDVQLTWPSGTVQTLFGGTRDVEIVKDTTL